MHNPTSPHKSKDPFILNFVHLISNSMVDHVEIVSINSLSKFPYMYGKFLSKFYERIVTLSRLHLVWVELPIYRIRSIYCTWQKAWNYFWNVKAMKSTFLLWLILWNALSLASVYISLSNFLSKVLLKRFDTSLHALNS